MKDTDPEKEPILQPRLVRALRKRPKLIELEARERFLKNLEENISERRCPPNISDRLGRNVSKSIQQAAEPVAKDTLRERLTGANETVLSRL